MNDAIRKLSTKAVLTKLSELFSQSATDRQVYIVFGNYDRMRPLQGKLQKQVETGNLNALGRVEYLSLNQAIVCHMRAMGIYEDAANLADRRRDQEFSKNLSMAFRDLLTRTIESDEMAGLILADFELLYAYGLGSNDITLARQVAINGKRVCLLVPGSMRDGRLWIFDDDDESRVEFPEALVFRNSGWVFELTD